MGDRCTGDCCRSYTLPFQDSDLAELLSWQLASVFTGVPPPQQFQDSVAGIIMMSESIGTFTTNPAGEEEVPHVRYRCRNLLENGDCRIYESRPSMCRRYPYGDACRHLGCTWDENRPENLVPLTNGKIPLYSEVLDG